MRTREVDRIAGARAPWRRLADRWLPRAQTRDATSSCRRASPIPARGSTTAATTAASGTARSRRSRRPTSTSSSRSGRSRPTRSASSRRRRSSSTASSTSPDRTTRRGPSTRAPAARSGRYRRELPEGMDVCCGRVNRGFAVLGDRLFMNTLDAHLLALDMKTGAVVWDSVIDDYKLGYSATSAPARRQGQGHRRHRRRRVRASAASSTPTMPPPASARGASGRFPARRAGQRDVGRRLVEARRRLHVGHRQLRSRR